MSEKGVKLPKMSLFSKKKTNNFLLDHMIELLLVVMIIALSIAEPKFISVGNILNVLRNCAMKGVIAYGMCLVIISGEIDLSVGSQVALSAVIVAWVSKSLSAAGVMSQTMGAVVGVIAAIAGTSLECPLSSSPWLTSTSSMALRPSFAAASPSLTASPTGTSVWAPAAFSASPCRR